MSFHLIDMANWDRRERYEHYLNDVRCTYSMTVDVDITSISRHKLYPAMLWLLTSCVDRFPEFRTCLLPEGPGIFDHLEPSYTIFNSEAKSFSVIWTEFSESYTEFLHRYERDVDTYPSSCRLYPKDGMPRNTFDVSMIPWSSFTGFNLNVYGSGDHLLPIFTMGRAYDRDSRRLLPLSCQVHHAVCDGYHLSMFIKALQDAIDSFSG